MRTLNQIRPSNDPNAPVYAPQRDVANIFLPLLREVFQGLDQKHWPTYFTSLFEREGVDEADLARTVTLFTEAIRLFIRDREVNDPFEAFKKAGLNEHSDAVKFALFARLGEVITGGFFVAIRDVTMQGHESPLAPDMASMVAAGRELSERLSGKWTHYDVSNHERLKVEVEELTRVVSQLQRLRVEDERTIAEQRSTLAELSKHGQLILAATTLRSLKGWSRIKAAFRMGWALWRGNL